MHKKHVRAPIDMRNKSHPKIIMNSPQKIISGRRPGLAGLWAVLLILCTLGFALPASAATFRAVSKSLDSAQESCLPPNGSIDPGETNTVTFTFKNTTGAAVKGVKVSMKSEIGNVAFAVDGQKTVGDVAKDATFTVSFRFRADGPCGGTLSPRFTFEGKEENNTTTFANVDIDATDSDKFDFLLGPVVKTTYSFANTSSIAINDFKANSDLSKENGRATPFPSTITTANIPHQTGRTGERVSKITVTLSGVTHDWAPDLGVVLVAPKGQKILLMRRVGGETTTTAPLSNATLTFAAGGSTLPQNAQITSGTYAPRDLGSGDLISGQTPTSPYITDLASATLIGPGPGSTTGDQTAINNVNNPNGEWKLYVVDLAGGGQGQVAGGWSLSFETSKVSCCGSGETFPTITQSGKPSIADVEISEDNVYQSDDATKNTDVTSGANHPQLSTLPSFRLADLESDGDALASNVKVVSGNQNLIKDGNIKLIKGSTGTDGTDSARKFVNYTMDFKPEPNQNGTTTVTVSVTDSSNRTTSTTFNLKVNSVNDSPIFTSFPRNQAVNRGTSTPALSFAVSDVETAAGSLVVTGTSSDTAVVPDSNIIFGAVTGDGTQRTVTVVPAASGTSGTSGQTTITLALKDANNTTTTKTFIVDFSTPPGNPTIEPISATSTDEDTPKTITFTVRPDPGSSTPAGNLVLSATSNNTTVLPNANITFGGSGSERTVTLNPAANQFTAPGSPLTVTLTVTDGTKSQSTTFALTVNSVNDKPTITSIADQTINEDTASSDIPFTVGDIETAATALTMSAASSRTDLIPVGGITFPANSDANRTVKITPAADKFGKATITLTVTDANSGTTSTSFVVTVNAVNDAPTVASVTADNNTAADGTQGSLTTALAENATPTVVTINEDAGKTGSLDGDFVDGDASKGVKEQVLLFNAVTAGAGDETEQTVTLTVSTDKPEIISNLRITDSGSTDTKNTAQGASVTKALRYTPVRNAYGDATVTLTLTDNGVGGVGANTLQTVRKFKISVRAQNDRPTLDDVGNLSGTRSNKQGVSVPINVNDTETAKVNLTMAGTSSNPTLVQDANITFDAARSRVAIVPESTASGTVTITITATDRGPTDADSTGAVDNADRSKRMSISDTFTVTFGDVIVPNPPTISLSSTSILIDEDGVATTTATIRQTVTGGASVSDADLQAITISGSSDSQTIVPNANILVGSPVVVGGTATRSIAVVPAKDAFGVVKVTLTAVDKNGLGSESVVLTINIRSVEDDPSISFKKSTDSGTKWSVVGGVDTFTDKEDVNPVSDPKTASGLIEVTVSDALFETSADSLTVTATSGNTDLVPNGNITVSTSGSTRTIRIVPAAQKSGTATITAKVKDASNREVTAAFNLVINAINDAPNIDAIGNVTIDEDAGLQTISLSGINAGNSEESAQTISVTASAKDKGSDPAVNNLISAPAVTYTSPNTTGTLTFTPVANKFGTSTITVTVTDSGASGGDHVNSKAISFDVLLREINDTPTISVISDVSTNQDSTIGPIAITVGDVETAAEQLTLSFSSDNTALIPNSTANLQATGSGPNRGVIIVPVKGVFGSANVTATVSDKGKTDGSDVKSASRTFKVTVNPSDKPTISSVATQTTQKNQDTDVITFTVFDAQTPADQLVVTAGSDNTVLVPVANVQFASGTGGTRQMIIRPAANQSGSANITLTVKDADNNTASTSFRLNVLGEKPTITAIADQRNVAKGGTVGPLSFTVNDAETFPGFLTLSATSSDPTFVAASGVSFGGSGQSRTVTVGPVANADGSSTITITVRDTEGQTASTSFVVATPIPVNNAPTISTIPNQSTEKDTPTPVIAFTISDSETAASSFVNGATTGARISASSDNAAVVPVSNIFLGGAGANRTVFISPAAGAEGVATITITVTDDGPGTPKSSSTSFTLTVSANNPPTISSIAAQTTQRGVATAPIAFTIGDDKTPVANLTVTRQSDNSTLAPVSGIVVSGTGASRTVTITPAAGQVGTANITLTVTDAGGKTASTTFALTVTAPPAVEGDFDGDGKADLLFQDNGGFLAAWFMDGATLVSANYLIPSNIGDTAFRIVGTGDFNSDGKEDILFQHTDGTVALWLMDGTFQSTASLLSPSNPGDRNWRVVGTGDLNKDGKVDVLFQNSASGLLAVWYMNGSTLQTAALLSPSDPGDANWKVAAAGDLNGDGNVDIVFQHTNGTLAAWYLNGATLTTPNVLSPSNPGAGWRVIGATDRNGDGRADLVFQHTDSTLAVWYMNGFNMTTASLLGPGSSGASWKVVGPK